MPAATLAGEPFSVRLEAVDARAVGLAGYLVRGEADRAVALAGFNEAEAHSYLRYQVKEALDKYLQNPDSPVNKVLLRARVDPDLIRDRLLAMGKPAAEIETIITELESAFREVGSQDALEDIRALVEKGPKSAIADRLNAIPPMP